MIGNRSRSDSGFAGLHGGRDNVSAQFLATIFWATALLVCPDGPLRGQRPTADAFSLFEKPTRVVAAASRAKLAMYCAGKGQPTVLLESGVGGNSAESWYRVLPLIARQTRVCAYD